MKSLSAFILIQLIMAAQGTLCAASEPMWPVIENIEKEFLINSEAEKIFIQVPIKEKNTNKTLYTFLCRGGSVEYLDKISAEKDINYTPDLGCRLFEGETEKEFSLLSEDGSAPWHSRGQIRYSNLTGDCGKYPEYGANRNFYLRGFELSLRFSPIPKSNHTSPTEFEFKITAKPNSVHKSAQAAQPGYLTPYKTGRDCKKIIKGNATRMCRDWNNGGIWVECDKLNKN